MFYVDTASQAAATCYTQPPGISTDAGIDREGKVVEEI
jgi:hypothetical protein